MWIIKQFVSTQTKVIGAFSLFLLQADGNDCDSTQGWPGVRSSHPGQIIFSCGEAGSVPLLFGGNLNCFHNTLHPWLCLALGTHAWVSNEKVFLSICVYKTTN